MWVCLVAQHQKFAQVKPLEGGGGCQDYKCMGVRGGFLTYMSGFHSGFFEKRRKPAAASTPQLENSAYYQFLAARMHL